jgi:hypothetical protein
MQQMSRALRTSPDTLTHLLRHHATDVQSAARIPGQPRHFARHQLNLIRRKHGQPLQPARHNHLRHKVIVVFVVSLLSPVVDIIILINHFIFRALIFWGKMKVWFVFEN